MLGKNIKDVREMKGMTQRELAFKTRIPLNEICNYEADLIEPTLSQLIEIAKALQTSIDLLVDYKPWEYDEDFKNFFDRLLDESPDYNDSDEDNESCDEAEDCEECDSFAPCIVKPHMQNFLQKYNDGAYMHIEIGDDHLAIVVGGKSDTLTAGINMIIEEICKQGKMDYYDYLQSMATARTEMIKEKRKNENGN